MSALFTTSTTKSVSKEIPDTSFGGAASKKTVDEKGPAYVKAMSEKSDTPIKSDKDISVAKIKLAKEYADNKITSTTTTISRKIDTVKSSVSDGVSVVIDGEHSPIKAALDLKRSLVSNIQSACEGANDLIGNMINGINTTLNQLQFDDIFDDVLKDINLSDLLEVLSKCVFWAKSHSVKLASSAEEFTKLGDVGTYKNILKAGVVLPSGIDRKCKNNVINKPAPGRTKSEHVADVESAFTSTGDTTSEFYKTTSEGISTVQTDISSDTFDMDKTDIDVALLFGDESTIKMASAIKQQYV